MIVLQDAVAARAYSRGKRKEGKTVALVPTMGYLHQGHLALVKAAKQHADIIIVSIYINPTQFSANEDFGTYPKSLERDHKLLEELAVDAIFQPTSLYATRAESAAFQNPVAGASELRPGDHETFVQVELLQQPLCGKSRPHFFKGVATVVTKLFNIVEPDVALFGRKDYQQLQLIRKMVRDLDFGIEIIGLPIVREEDGLAMSSRNVLLSSTHRAQAPQIYKALERGRQAVRGGDIGSAKQLEAHIISHLIELTDGKIDYIQIVDAGNLLPVINVREQPCVLAVAVFFGPVRLIDNILLNE